MSSEVERYFFGDIFPHTHLLFFKWDSKWDFSQERITSREVLSLWNSYSRQDIFTYSDGHELVVILNTYRDPRTSNTEGQRKRKPRIITEDHSSKFHLWCPASPYKNIFKRSPHIKVYCCTIGLICCHFSKADP